MFFFFYFLQVSDTFDNVTQTAAQADNMFMEASTTIQRANSVGMYNRQTASDLLNRATNAANLSQQYLGVSSRDLQLLSWHNHHDQNYFKCYYLL